MSPSRSSPCPGGRSRADSMSLCGRSSDVPTQVDRAGAGLRVLPSLRGHGRGASGRAHRAGQRARLDRRRVPPLREEPVMATGSGRGGHRWRPLCPLSLRVSHRGSGHLGGEHLQVTAMRAAKGVDVEARPSRPRPIAPATQRVSPKRRPGRCPRCSPAQGRQCRSTYSGRCWSRVECGRRPLPHRWWRLRR